MFKINGKYSSAAVYAADAEDYAIAQIQAICDSEAAEGSKICIMPDVHPGKVGPIGLTMTIGSKIMPSLIGIDIGCGISYRCLKSKKVEFQKLDRVIRERVPSGFQLRKEPHHLSGTFDFDRLLCKRHIDEERARLSLGTLGGGNHFIELERDDEGNLYAVVHSGSRHLGKEVTEFYLREGQRRMKATGLDVPYELTCLEGQLMEDYLHDLMEVEAFAALNRKIILDELERNMKWKATAFGESVHNYVDENRILRKGAAAAYEDREVIIPVNMKDGVIFGKGKGNLGWNYSAPHGGGRIMARGDVKKSHTLSEYRKLMSGIHSPSINKETLDEAPFAYRGIEEILSAIKDTVTVEEVMRPVYNYKAGSR